MHWIDYFRLCFGIAFFVAGIILWFAFPFIGKVVPVWTFVVGGVIVFHSLVDLLPEFGGTSEYPKFFVDSCRTIVAWLVVASGVMIGVVTQADSSRGVMTHIAIYSLATSIVFGIIYFSVLIAAVKEEKVDSGKNVVTVKQGVFALAAIFLNLTFWLFIAGAVALAIDFVTSS